MPRPKIETISASDFKDRQFTLDENPEILIIDGDVKGEAVTMLAAIPFPPNQSPHVLHIKGGMEQVYQLLAGNGGKIVIEGDVRVNEIICTNFGEIIIKGNLYVDKDITIGSNAKSLDIKGVKLNNQIKEYSSVTVWGDIIFEENANIKLNQRLKVYNGNPTAKDALWNKCFASNNDKEGSPYYNYSTPEAHFTTDNEDTSELINEMVENKHAVINHNEIAKKNKDSTPNTQLTIYENTSNRINKILKNKHAVINSDEIAKKKLIVNDFEKVNATPTQILENFNVMDAQVKNNNDFYKENKKENTGHMLNNAPISETYSLVIKLQQLNLIKAYLVSDQKTITNEHNIFLQISTSLNLKKTVKILGSIFSKQARGRVGALLVDLPKVLQTNKNSNARKTLLEQTEFRIEKTRKELDEKLKVEQIESKSTGPTGH